MVKIDIDKNPPIAGQLRVQSIPAVFAFVDGRPVDGFVGALPESQIKQFVDRLAKLGGGGADDGLEEALNAAAEALEAGDAARPRLYAQALQIDPTNPGHRRPGPLPIAVRRLGTRRQVLDAPRRTPRTPESRRRAALALAAERPRSARSDVQRPGWPPTPTTTRRASNSPRPCAGGKREEAVDQLLELIRRDRDWNEQAARKQLLTVFEAGPTDQLTPRQDASCPRSCFMSRKARAGPTHRPTCRS